MPQNDRMEMSLDQVIKKDWKPQGNSKGRGRGSKEGNSKGRGRGSKGGRGIVRDARVPAKVKRGTKGQKGGARGAKGRGMPKGRGKAARTGRGAGERQTSSGRGGSVRQPQQTLRNLWRGARAPARSKAPQANGVKAWVRRSSPGSTTARGKGRVTPPQRNLKKVNRAGGIQKRGRAMGSFSKGVTRRKGAGKGAYGKGTGAQAIANADYGKGYSKSGSGSSKGKGGGKRSGYKGGGSWDQGSKKGGNKGGSGWDQDFADGGSKGKNGKGGYVEEQKATDQLTAEDKRMMKKITIVAQLDKVPKPHPAMQGMAPGKNSRRRSEGSLSSRFAANYRR